MSRTSWRTTAVIPALAVVFGIFAPALSLAQDAYPDKPIEEKDFANHEYGRNVF